MMREYLHLQYVMAKRKVEDAGVHPLLGFLLGTVVFGLVSEVAYQKTSFAPYLLILLCIGLLLRLNERGRIDFLRILYGDRRKSLIRIVENTIITIPFMVVFCLKQSWMAAATLSSLAAMMAVLDYRVDWNKTLPTPFSKRPFEFAVGFRKSFLMFPLAYLIVGLAINIDNFNLGIFSMLLVFVTTFTYFSKPEDEFYVWIFAASPKHFLMKKISTALKHSSLLVAPIVISLSLFYPSDLQWILLFFILGMLFLATIILAKYAAYPNEMNLPEGILIAICLYFPPLLLAVVPYLYHKSINHLKHYLNDQY